MELLSKLRELRSQAHSSGSTVKTNTKQPIYDRIEQDKVMGRIEKTLDPMFALFWRVSIATGWRTSDVCELRFSDIDFNTGKATIVVNKQTKAAEARAYNKCLKLAQERMKKAAAMAGDLHQYMIIDQTSYKDIMEVMTPDQVTTLESELLKAVSTAPQKIDTKKLPVKVLDEIKARQEANIFDDYVFSRRLMRSHRAKNESGHCSRQGVWKALKTVFVWFSAEVNGALKLSAYSSRKTFAYNMMKGKDGKGNFVSEVCEAFGHSSLSITFKYLSLQSKADELQAQMCEVYA